MLRSIGSDRKIDVRVGYVGCEYPPMLACRALFGETGVGATAKDLAASIKSELREVDASTILPIFICSFVALVDRCFISARLSIRS